MMMKKIKKSLTYVLSIICSSLMLVTTSCDDENVGEYKLTGNIEHLIPSAAYDLKVDRSTASNVEKYVVYSPYMSENFENWGLSVKKVDYYVDGKLFESATSEPFDLMIKLSALGEGKHALLAKILVVGEYCDDLTLEVKDEFVVSENNTVTDFVDFYIDSNHVGNGGTLYVNPILNVQRSSPGTKIEEIKYYWDGKLVLTKTTAPFVWNTQVVDEDTEPHSWSLTIKYSNADNKTNLYNYSYGNVTTIKDDDSFTYFDLMSGRNDYELGETIKSVVKSFRGKNFKQKISVKLYFDDELIGSSSIFPYYNDFKLTNQKIGKHIIKCAITQEEKDFSSTYYNEETIIITPSNN